MPWFTPSPSQEELDFWQFKPTGFLPLIPHWPKPNSARVNCFFLMKDTFPAFIPIAGRYGFYFTEVGTEWDPTKEDTNEFAALDFQGIGPNHVRGVLGQSPAGFDVTIDIEALPDLPIINGDGIRATVVADHAQHGTQTVTGIWDRLPLRQNWFYNQNTDLQLPTGNWQFENDPQWNIPLLLPHIFAAHDCYGFPRDMEEFARFNGVDAFIDLSFSTGVDSGPFRISCDMRLQDRIANPILAFQSANSGYQTIGEALFWGPVEIANNFMPANDVWFNLVTEFEWELGQQLTYQVFVDDVLAKQTTTNRQFFNISQLGKRNSGPSAVFGHFDMRNLFWERGTFASPVVELDMKLMLNALDDGPTGNHGTTFNMQLPSV